MKKILVLIFFFHTSLTFAQHEAKSDEKQVQDLIQHMFDGLFSDFDSEKIPEYMTDDFILLEDGMVWDNQIIKDYLDGQKAKSNLSNRENKFEFIRTKIDGNQAWVAYHNWAIITQGDKVVREVHWLESATAIKSPTGWKLEMLHSTPVKQEVP